MAMDVNKLDMVAPRYKHTVVAIFDKRDEMVAAARELHSLGFGHDRISVMARDAEGLQRAAAEADVIGLTREDELDEFTNDVEPKGRDEAAGMAIGGTVGFVLGLTAIAIPGFGAFLLAAGPVAVVLNALTTSAAGLGMGALLGAILDENVTETHRDYYHQRLERGDWLMIVHGEESEINQATRHLRGFSAAHVDAF